MKTALYLCLAVISAPFSADMPLTFVSADPSGPLMRVPSVDVEQPIPLPILARPQKDRASLADPTMEASSAAALAPVNVRRSPLPFLPINLPDPFEHSQAVRLRATPDEVSTPPAITPRTPANR